MNTIIKVTIGIVLGYVFRKQIKEHIVDPFQKGLESAKKPSTVVEEKPAEATV